MQTIKRRKPIVALLMSAVLPGFGQLYNGEVNRGIWLFLGFLFLNVPWTALLALYVSGVLLAPLLLLTFGSAFAIWVFGMVDAWRHAKTRQDYVPEGWQCSGAYVLVFVVCNIVALPALTIYIRGHLIEPFRIPSASMAPTVLAGDFLFADKRYNCGGCKYRIEQGDVAIFVFPDDRTLRAIKRVIGLPGDRVNIEGHVVRVNGVPLSMGSAESGTGEVTERAADGHTWTVKWDPARPAGPAVDLIVPPGQVFVLGDNRSHSRDSRQMGPVPEQDVIGRARQIWLSYGAGGIRWSRLGRSVR